MRHFILLASIAIVAMMITSCEEGPTGADPGQELSVLYNDSFDRPIYLNKSADLIMNVEGKRITQLICLSNRVSTNDVQFFQSQNPSFSETPRITLSFTGGMPTAPGEFTWGTGTNSGTVLISNPDNSTAYISLEGKTVVTGVRSENGITKISGYFNGTLKSATGEILVAQSGVFFVR